MEKKKQCSQCGLSKPGNTKYFRRDSGRDDGLRSECKDCGSKKKKREREENSKKEVNVKEIIRADIIEKSYHIIEVTEKIIATSDLIPDEEDDMICICLHKRFQALRDEIDIAMNVLKPLPPKDELHIKISELKDIIRTSPKMLDLVKSIVQGEMILQGDITNAKISTHNNNVVIKHEIIEGPVRDSIHKALT